MTENQPKLEAVTPPPAPRSIEKITEEYGAICKEAGQVQYQLKIMQMSLDDFNRKLLQLNQEAHAAKEASLKKSPTENKEELTPVTLTEVK